MKYLVGDIGNTLIKISLLNKNFKIFKTYNIETSKIKKKIFLLKFFKNINIQKINKNILFSSVVPSVYNTIKLHLKKKKFKVFEIKDLKVKKIIKLNVKNSKQVGSDRIANAIGAINIFKTNCLIIDFGTATTFDIVRKQGYYDGGVIAPGIKPSIDSLNKSTALLPSIKLKKTLKPYGKNTIEAINAGFVWGYQGLINNIIKKISLYSKINFKIILTGGYASMFRKYIYKQTIVEENITIKGIIKTYKKFLI